MDESLRDWEPTDLDLADLQCLARQYSKIVGIRKTTLAEMAASLLNDDAVHSPANHSSSTERDFKLFLTRWNHDLVSRFRPHAAILVQAIIRHAESRPRDKNAAKVAETCKLLVRHPNFREVAAGSEFMAVRDRWRTTELGDFERSVKSENNLFAAFNRLAQDFSDYSHDAHLRHDRIKPALAPSAHGGNGSDAGAIDGQYILIRRSSQTPQRFVAHALLIGVHADDERVLYFSEQLRALQGEVETNRRMTQGVCVFDGQYMTALARPRFNTYFTYFSAKIDDVDAPLDWFRAIVVTANRNGRRISAEALCLRCENRKDRESKVGIFTARELILMFSGPQRDALNSWVETATPVILL